ncbi:hypothetical protein [Demequina zhanjiangensis]|uniref:Uncharacterized protein n=1 Tax=Demequina zhanjiangensis TaxID=3051659 RepID=A0ABT8G4Y8_9MICO|nr:hypothetical protein [Demequina sp. SYSU T00b26]MDN4473994.1 hypothetical protein [Demequina sp. SYSU T00b26]
MQHVALRQRQQQEGGADPAERLRHRIPIIRADALRAGSVTQRSRSAVLLTWDARTVRAWDAWGCGSRGLVCAASVAG